MSDNATTQADATTEATGQTPTPQSEQTEATGADATDWKAEARKWEARAKANSQAAKKLASLEDANRTDAEKLARATRRIEQLEQAQQQAQWRAEVSKATGVPAELLRGASVDEMTAHAEAIKSWQDARAYPVVKDTGRRPQASTTAQQTSEFITDLFRHTNKE